MGSCADNSMASLEKWLWRWHRVQAMNGPEIFGHLRRHWWQMTGRHTFQTRLDAASKAGWEASRLSIPLPHPAEAPEKLKSEIRSEARRLESGKWRAFGHLPIQVDDPPRWQSDYFVGVDLQTDKPARRLNHRALPQGADIKLVWELSRWSPLVTLAQAAFINEDLKAARTCVRWLADWDLRNPAFSGWNWTSALEAGIRLIQFVVIDQLLSALCCDGDQGTGEKRELALDLGRLRGSLLPRHAWMAWRLRSFGTSANNHLLGELAGLILAVVRWPVLAGFSAPLEQLHRLWEVEVLRQFAPDGGNREQALNYQLFAWEFCWLTQQALSRAGVAVSDSVVQRLQGAAGFFAAVWKPGGWDYGDSDSAWVVPFCLPGADAAESWCQWFRCPEESPAINYWCHPAVASTPKGLGFATNASKPLCAGSGWRLFADSGIAYLETGPWFLRWDLSPLGYLRTASHGHLDALHLSIWVEGRPLVIDPGTGAYYGDPRLRAHLASWEAHNGPLPFVSPPPRRLGPFLWADHHAVPRLVEATPELLMAELHHPQGVARRSVRVAGNRVEVTDSYAVKTSGENSDFRVGWQFPPGSSLEQTSERAYRLQSGGCELLIEASAAWSQSSAANPSRLFPGHPAAGDLRGVCSSRFREARFGPTLELFGEGEKPCVFETSFLVSPALLA